MVNIRGGFYEYTITQELCFLSWLLRVLKLFLFGSAAYLETKMKKLTYSETDKSSQVKNFTLEYDTLSRLPVILDSSFSSQYKGGGKCRSNL